MPKICNLGTHGRGFWTQMHVCVQKTRVHYLLSTCDLVNIKRNLEPWPSQESRHVSHLPKSEKQVCEA